MAKQTINLGTVNGGNGDPLRVAFDKINDNFDELYAKDATDFNPGSVSQSIIPDTDVTYDLGSATNRFRDLYLSGSSIDLGGTTLSVVGGVLKLGGTDVITQTDLDAVVTGIVAGNVDLTPYATVASLADVATSGDYADLTNKPTIPVNINNLGDVSLTDPVNGDLLTYFNGTWTNAALLNYITTGSDISLLNNDAGYITTADITNGTLTVDVNNTGDLQGSVFGNDSTLLVDATNSKLVGDVENITINTQNIRSSSTITGNLLLQGSSTATGTGGSITIWGGSGFAAGNGGIVTIDAGSASGSGTKGGINIGTSSTATGSVTIGLPLQSSIIVSNDNDSVTINGNVDLSNATVTGQGFTYSELGGMSEIGVTADVFDFGDGKTIDMQNSTILFTGSTVSGLDVGASVSISDTPPGSPSAGDLWWESTTGRLKIYYSDGDTSQWVDAHYPSSGSDNPFDQDLNTTDSPAFTGLTVDKVSVSSFDTNTTLLSNVLTVGADSVGSQMSFGRNSFAIQQFQDPEGESNKLYSQLQLSGGVARLLGRIETLDNLNQPTEHFGTVNAEAGRVTVQAYTGGTAVEWTFDESGITFPDATVQTTAWTGSISSLDGDVTGSVFADDSTLLVDGVNGRLVGPLLTNSIASPATGNLQLDVGRENGGAFIVTAWEDRNDTENGWKQILWGYDGSKYDFFVGGDITAQGSVSVNDTLKLGSLSGVVLSEGGELDVGDLKITTTEPGTQITYDFRIGASAGSWALSFPDGTRQETALQVETIAQVGYRLFFDTDIYANATGGATDANETAVQFASNAVVRELFDLTPPATSTAARVYVDPAATEGQPDPNILEVTIVSGAPLSVGMSVYAIVNGTAVILGYIDSQTDATTFRLMGAPLTEEVPIGTEFEFYGPGNFIEYAPINPITIFWDSGEETVVTAGSTNSPYGINVFLVTAENQTSLTYPIEVVTNNYAPAEFSHVIDADNGFKITTKANDFIIDSNEGPLVFRNIGGDLVLNANGQLVTPGHVTLGGQTYTNSGIIWQNGPGAIINNNNIEEYFIIATSTNTGTQQNWKFGYNGVLTFPDSTIQETAWAGGRVVAVPTTSLGTTGDLEGDLAFNATYMYYCTQNFASTVINMTSISSSGIPRAYIIMYDSNTGWTSADLTGYAVSGPSYTGTVTGPSQDQGGGLWYIPVTPNVTQGMSIYSFTSPSGGNIWKRIAWSGDTW